MKTLIIISLIVNSCIIFGQQAKISGYITDEKTGEVLIGAHVFIEKSKIGATSNSYGFFSITLPTGDSLDLAFSYIGYQTNTIRIYPKSNKHVNISLQQGNLLNEVTIIGEHQVPIERRNEMSIISIPINQIENLPALGGESDILKAIQLMPGVKSGSEASSGIFVRGGSPDQNLVLLDDVPLYYVNHLGGFVSIFNTDAINNVKLIKGGFPARYGGRLSSVIDVRMKDGNLKEFEGSAMIGMISSKVSLQGSIKKDTSSYIVSFRRFMYDLITIPISKLVFDGFGIGYTFYDFNLKLNHKLSNKDRLYFSTYMGDDKLSLSFREKDSHKTNIMKSGNNWGNFLTALRWNRIYGSQLFSNITLAYTRYRYNTFISNTSVYNDYSDIFNNTFLSGINDFSAKMDFDYYINSSYKIRFGGNIIRHDFNPGQTTYNLTEANEIIADTIHGNFSLNAHQTNLYAENEISLWNKLNFNIGCRVNTYHVDDTSFYYIEPRLLSNIMINDRLSLKMSYSRMQQNVHLLSNSSVGMPTDLWLPATKTVQPSKAEQYAIGTAQTFKKNIEFSIEAYYKKMTNLIAYSEGSTFTDFLTDWQCKVENDGIGKAYGIEFLLQKKSGRTSGWIGYTISRTTRQFNNINNGQPFLHKYDRTHDFSIAWVYNISENINTSATWVFSTGNPFTLATGTYIIQVDDNYKEIHIYDGINTFRMKPYHRLDIGINFSKQKNNGKRVWNISIFNVYNRQNPYYYFFRYDEQIENRKRKLYQQSLFPIMPSVSYSFHF